MRVKVCGITNLEDALLAIRLGTDALGFIFYDKSPRAVSLELARFIIKQLPPFISSVGVFVNSTREDLDFAVSYCGLTAVQLHGVTHESLAYPVIQAIQVGSFDDLAAIDHYVGIVSGILLDTKKEGYYGGTGQVFDWDLAIEAKKRKVPIILSGGLNPDNVSDAIRLVNPYAVDVSSGLESTPGKKDPEKMGSFFRAVLNS